MRPKDTRPATADTRGTPSAATGAIETRSPIPFTV
jgi:hypothetical protein